MTKIIAGVDDPDRSRDAVALAARLARATGVDVEAVSAYPYDDVAGRSANSGFRRLLREEAEQRIATACEGIEAPDILYRTIADTHAARGIQDLALHDGGAMIVIASSHRGAMGRVLAGTVAERLLHGAPCPVAVAPKGYAERSDAPIETIGVAYDGSAESEAALTGAVAMARALGARLRVIGVLDTMIYGTPALMSGPGFIAVPDDLRDRTRESLEQRVRDLPGDVAAEMVALEGDPEHELSEQTAKVDLMVTGSRGYGPHRAVLLGSVSGRLVRDASCPVIVVPRGIEAPLEAIFAPETDTQAV